MSVRLRLVTALVTFSLVACPKSESSVQTDRSAPVDAGVVDPARERLKAQVTSLSKETAAWSRAVDEKLWQHWTTGAAFDLTPLTASHDALLTAERRALLAEAIAQNVDDPRALEHLALFLDAERLTKETAAESQAIATLESTLTFPFAGKEVRWHDLNRLLATEQSALKRKALWTASLPAAEKLDAALMARDAKAAQVLAPRTPFQFSAELRDVDTEALRKVAEGVLTVTSEAWRLTLERLNAADTKLPVGSLTRADLPRLLRVPADVDLAFGKKELSSRAVTTLGAIGLYGQKGLTLDLSEAVKKNPLPLTVTPGGPTDVRTSFRPLGGMKDQQLLFSELGVALALQHVTVGRFEYERLGDSSLAQTSGELFATLVGEPQWLEAQALQEPARKAIIDAWQVQRLFQIRRAAAVFLVRLDCVEKSDEGSKARAAAIFTRAFGVTHTEADLVRLHLDTDDALRSATTLRAMLLAEHLRVQLNTSLGASWFTVQPAGRSLAELWSTGSAMPTEARLVSLGDALTSFWKRTVELTPVGKNEGGLTVGEWPAPKSVERPMSTSRPWPRTRIMEQPIRDAGWTPKDWPQPKTLEAWVPKAWPQPKTLESPDAGVTSAP